MWIRGAHAGTATASPQSTEGSGLVCMGAGAGAWGVGPVSAGGTVAAGGPVAAGGTPGGGGASAGGGPGAAGRPAWRGGAGCARRAPGDRPAGGVGGLAGGTGASRASASLIVSPGGAGTVCAHSGVSFCIGTACFGSLASSGGSVLVQSGRVSLMGLAVRGSPSEAVSLMDCAPLSLTGGATGTVRAQTGVVSCVGTAVTGGSGGVDSSGFSGSGSTSIVKV